MRNFSLAANLSITGHSDIDFVDIPTDTDVLLYIDPERIKHSDSPYANDALLMIDDFFHTLCLAARNEDKEAIWHLLSFGREPNETHLGHSSARSCGRGVTPDILSPIIENIFRQRLFQDGLVQELSDLPVLTHNFDADRLSDLCTNIIRSTLYRFTSDQMALWKIQLPMCPIPMVVWDCTDHNWAEHILFLPFVSGRPVLLCPKTFVCTKLLLSPGEFLQKSILTHRQQEHLGENSSLCRMKVLKDGTTQILSPTKRDIRVKEISGQPAKSYIQANVRRDPSLLAQYRQEIHCGDVFLSDQALDSLLYQPNFAIG